MDGVENSLCSAAAVGFLCLKNCSYFTRLHHFTALTFLPQLIKRYITT
jgi:hypothetical protein